MSALALPTMGAVLTSANVVTPVEGGDSYLNVGTEVDVDTWSGDLVIGDTSESTGDVDNVGAFNDDWDWVTPDKTVLTSELKVEGNITVQGNGKVVLGGYFSDTRYMGLEATENITVNGGSLTATKIIANNLVVNGGTVSTHTAGCNNGVSSVSVARPALQSYIKNSLIVNGGSLSFGYAAADIKGNGGDHDRMTTIGDMASGPVSILQTGGTMRVYGDMGLWDGATVTQQDDAGVLMLRDTVWLDSSGTTTFNQSADSAALVIGRLESSKTKNVHGIVFNQSGDGLIHLAYGSNFAKEGTIAFNQTGNGTINIGGGHDIALTGVLPTDYALDKVDPDISTSSFEGKNTTYTLEQSGAGTINVNGALSANEVRVGGESKLNLNEDVTVNNLTQSGKGKVTVAEGKTLTTGGMTIEGGVFENHGTVSGAATQAMLADADFFLITISGGEYVNHGTMEGSILMDGGTFTMENGAVAGGLTATSGTIYLNGDVTFTGKVILGTESSVSTFALLKATNSGSDALTLYINQGATINADELTVGSGTNIAVVLNKGVEYTEGMELFTVSGTDADQVAAVQSELGSKLSVYEYGNTEGPAAYTGGAIGSITTTVVPEPATATLSLLVLAALAARRRRK